MTSLAVRPTGKSRHIAPPEDGEGVHIVTWRLLDYDGNELTYGGLQRWLLALIDLLRTNGHTVTVHQRAKKKFTRELLPGVTVRGHRSAARSWNTPWFNLMAHRSIPSDAPVIYMADDVTYPICRKRSLVIQHGIWWDGECGPVKLRLVEHVVRRAVKRTAGLVCVDTNFINWLRARWPMLGVDQKLHFVPNFIQPTDWGPPPERAAVDRRADDPITICFPRRSEPRRGALLMGKIAPTLLDEYPNIRFRFIVGSGYYTDQLRALLTNSGADAKRWTIEVLPFGRMREAYVDSAIVTIPTLCGEGTSLSAIEAMYFGCAVVSTWVGGLPNLIQNGQNGILIAPDADELTAALRRLIDDPKLRIRLGRRAMRTVLPQFGIERWQKQIRYILREHLALDIMSPSEVRR